MCNDECQKSHAIGCFNEIPVDLFFGRTYTPELADLSKVVFTCGTAETLSDGWQAAHSAYVADQFCWSGGQGAGRQRTANTSWTSSAGRAAKALAELITEEK
jgi:hypothetical protein